MSPTLAREGPPLVRRPLLGWCGQLGGGWVGVGAAEDVGVPEGGRAVLLRRWGGDRLAGAQGHPPGVDGRTVGSVADVVPHRRPIVTSRRRVDVVAQELRRQVVLARPAG